jgi:uncharacterized protein Veg
MNCFVGVKKREKVMLMATKEVLAEIKQDLETFIGTRVKLKSFKGRNKVVEREGVLERTYPNIFVIKLDEKRTQRRVSLILIPWKSREKFVLLSLLFVNIFLLSRIISSFFIGR